VPGFDRFIRPQTPDRFEIKVSAPRSSVHRSVSVRLVYSDGHSTTSSPYTIRIFQPTKLTSALAEPLDDPAVRRRGRFSCRRRSGP
jgi:hypothetical protein